jgi:hypothetical protein
MWRLPDSKAAVDVAISVALDPCLTLHASLVDLLGDARLSCAPLRHIRYIKMSGSARSSQL